MTHVAPKDSLEVTAPQDQDVIEALGSHGSSEPFSVGVRSRGSDGGWDDPDTLGSEDLVEGTGELRVPIVDEEPNRR